MDTDTLKVDLEKLSSEELLSIWKSYDLEKYKREAFPLIKDILTERGVDVLPKALYDIVDSDKRSIPSGYKIHKNNRSGISDFFKFKVLISSYLIQITYLIGMIMITVSGYNLTVKETGNSLVGPSILIFGNLFWRIFCEVSIIFFRIHDSLASIDKKM